MIKEQVVTHPRLCIATCTRGRPEMLLRMLSSFESLHQPEGVELIALVVENDTCLLYTSPSPRDGLLSRMPSSA